MGEPYVLGLFRLDSGGNRPDPWSVSHGLSEEFLALDCFRIEETRPTSDHFVDTGPSPTKTGC